ncbi:REP-associated tyrosine transposase [Aeoliella mucimassa]|uniref:Transposase IS200 like protein n=1 Tax=Aeoliella mucimassa TaxID=2527972 RepID=A0A518AKY6_9BACT|nr:transposase [Aeoliella mucimassa]QDU55356.1 Transposase IS200 like protein [Aeoliella mucimassa]
MPRTARASQGGFVYHVLNRGNARGEVFHKDDDFAAFVHLMVEASERLPMRLVGYCLMPNHFHLLLWSHHDGDLSRWMQWLLTSHVRRYHRHYQSSGHVWQGRFKAFPIQDDEHYWTVLRYVERNPLRAGLVARSQDWEWSSLKSTTRSCPEELLSDGPLEKFRGWTNYVNGTETEAELAALRKSVERGTPYGDTDWQHKTAKSLGLESSLRPRGRPKKAEK